MKDSRQVEVSDCIMTLIKGFHLSLDSIKEAYLKGDEAHKAEPCFNDVLTKCVSECRISSIKIEVPLFGISIKNLGFRDGAEMKDILNRVYDTGGNIPSIDHVTLGVLTPEEALLSGLSDCFQDLPEGKSLLLGMHPVSRIIQKRRHKYLFKVTKQNGILISGIVPLKTTSKNVFPPNLIVLFAVRSINELEL